MNIPMNDNERQRLSRSYLLPVEVGVPVARRAARHPLRPGIQQGRAAAARVGHPLHRDRLRQRPRPSQGAGRGDAGAAKTPEELKLAKRRAGLARFYEQARAFGRLVSERGGALKDNGGTRDNVITGGGPGVMEAANRGAHDVGCKSVGLNITLPEEQAPNPYTTPDLTFRFHYFAIRKMHLAMRANALAVFPGGFGTLDELFEILTLIQTRKAPPVPVVLFGREYWRKVINFDTLIEHEVISPDDLKLFDIVDSPRKPGTPCGTAASRPTRRPTTPSATAASTALSADHYLSLLHLSASRDRKGASTRLPRTP
jgi:uncharacterized protein (TIGR00730 family)